MYYNNLECPKDGSKYRIYIMFKLADDYKKQLNELKKQIEKNN
jgi:rRNA maturation protein Nop10